MTALQAAVLALAGATGALAADEPGLRPSAPGAPSPPSVQVPRLAAPPRLEAFLDMRPGGEVEAQMARVTGFVQREPEDGQPASQRTHVYLGYDDDNLYAVFVAFDDEPQKMRASLGRREQVFGDETVEIQLDTYRDRRRAFSFLTNPFGIQWDAMWIEGQGFDDSFDTVWRSTGRLTESGYVVWMAIPFKSLRFAPLARQEWGVLLVRDIPRNNETSFWPAVTSRMEGRLDQAALLTGLEDISPGRNMQFIPYATSRAFKALDEEATGGPDFVRHDADTDLGLDAKMVLQDSLALDLTLNPDFSQVESDEPQVTVNERFEVQFPEKRPFFLENAPLFSTPINLLFTRRIADPRHGARLTGKMGGTSMGLLLIDDESPGRGRPDTDPLQGEDALFGVLRLSRDVGRQSHVGLLYTDRTLGDGFNRVGGVDGRFKLDDNWAAFFQSVASNTRFQDGPDLGGPAHSIYVNREGRHLNTHSHVQSYSDGFLSQPGFVPRVGIRDAHQMITYTVRPEGRRLIAWRPGIYLQRIEASDGERLDWNVHPSIQWELRGQNKFGLMRGFGAGRLRPEDHPGLLESRDFSSDFVRVWAESHLVEPVEIEVAVEVGDSINLRPEPGEEPGPADRLGVEVELVLRPLRRLRIDTDWLHTRLDTPTGARIFTNDILRMRWGWQFTPRLSLRSIFRYDDLDAEPGQTSLEDARSFNADLLLTYRVNPWTALYVGTNTNYRNLELVETGGMRQLVRTDDGYLNDARQVFIKLSYLIRP